MEHLLLFFYFWLLPVGHTPQSPAFQLSTAADGVVVQAFLRAQCKGYNFEGTIQNSLHESENGNGVRASAQ